MATEDRPDSRAVELLRAIAQAPSRLDLFQAIRRIESVFRSRARLGEGGRPAEEPIRITQEPSMAFAPSAIVGLEFHGEAPPRLQTAVLGLTGPNGPLPLHLTEYARDRLRNAGDPTLTRFLDVFHHRMLSLYCRAYANTQPAWSRDRPESDRFVTYVGAHVGLGLPSLRERDEVPDRLRLHFAGRFAAQNRNAEGLAAVVQSYFGVPAAVQPFVGEWVTIPESSRWRIGGPGVGSALGRQTALGRRALLCQGKFRIKLGPIGAGQLSRFLPGGESLGRLASIVRSYAGDQLGWDLLLILDEAAKRPWHLGSDARLGLSCWASGTPKTIVINPPPPARRKRSGVAERSTNKRDHQPPPG